MEGIELGKLEVGVLVFFTGYVDVLLVSLVPASIQAGAELCTRN